MPDKSGMHRVADHVRQSSFGAMARGAMTTVIAATLIGVVTMLVNMRDDAIASAQFTTVTAPAIHAEHKRRLDVATRPDLMVQLARATEAVGDVKAASQLAAENGASIRVMQTEMKHLGEGQKRVETNLERVLRKLDELQVRRP